MKKIQLGMLGESFARIYLEQNGFTILATNYRCGVGGEIDIIGLKDGRLAFIEVKTRSSQSLGDPLDSIDFYKMTSTKRTALKFLKTFKSYNQIGFDAISILIGSRTYKIKYYQDIYS